MRQSVVLNDLHFKDLHSALCPGATVRIKHVPDQNAWTRKHVGHTAVIVKRNKDTNLYAVVLGEQLVTLHVLDFELVCLPRI